MRISSTDCNGRLADVAGTAEPIYGASAIQPVTEQAKTVPYTELQKDDLKWRGLGGTNVETQTFYLFPNTGGVGLVQVIYSSVACVQSRLRKAKYNQRLTFAVA